MSAKATRDDVEPTTEADTRLGADVSVPFDRMTVEQFRKRFPSHGGVPHAKHGSSQAPLPLVVSRGGSRSWRRKPMHSPTRKAGTHLSSIRSRASILSLEERDSGSTLPILGQSSRSFARFPTRGGIATSSYGTFPFGRTESSRIDGRKSRKQRAGTNQKNGDAAPKRGRVPNRKRSRRRGPRSGSGDAIR